MDWCGIWGWINLLEVCEGSIARNGNGEGFCGLISILFVVETKTGGSVRSRLNTILMNLHNYTADRYSQVGGYIVLLAGEVGWGGGLGH